MKKQQVPSMKVYDNTILRLNLSPAYYDSSYEKYWEGRTYGFDLIELSDQEKDEMNILYLLESLGFPMGETGTFLYKQMIVEPSKELKNAGKQEKKMIKSAMTYPYSQFYFNIARNNLDMGIKTFHQFVSLSYENRFMNRVKPQTARRLGIDINSPDYMLQAYKIAEYYVKQKEANILEENENSYRRTTARQKRYTMQESRK